VHWRRTLLREADIQTIGHWLSPDFVIPAAQAHCEDPVLGADSAYAEVRGLIREYARFIRHREKEQRISLGLASSLRAMGFVGVYQPVSPSMTQWGQTALYMWDQSPGEINGWTHPIEVGDAAQSLVNRTVIRVLGQLFQMHPEFNKAILRHRIYQRYTSHVMVNIEAHGMEGPRSYVVDPHGLGDLDLRKRMRRARMAILKNEEHSLRDMGFQLMRAWIRTGLIASPAACMVSLAAQNGHAALAPFNGIPLAVQVGRVKDRSVQVFCTLDHRIYSGSHADFIYRYLEREVKRCA
jgi:hypothetical protein